MELPMMWLKKGFFGVELILGLFIVKATAVYDVPNNDADCPANCRQIPWKTGADLWNNGSLPVYPAIVCTGLVEGDGTVDNSAAIQGAIKTAVAHTAVYIPAGIYYVNGIITLKDNIVLRGAGMAPPFLPAYSANTTTLKFGPNGGIRMGNISKGPAIAVSGGYEKGSAALTVGPGHGLVTNDWVVMFEDPDGAIPVSANGSDGTCTWCGEASGASHLMSQIAQVTVNANNLILSRPMYYTFKSALNPALKKITFGIQYAGVEDIKLNGWSTARAIPHIRISGALHCWVKNVETYNTPDVAKAFPIYMEHSYGNEIRDSYFHYGQGNGSDRNYGIGLFFSTSDNKIENNIFRENRHSISQEGGGSGNAFLYNYIDDNYSDDRTYVGSPCGNHGAHPYMTLYEGNIISHMVVDDVWGSSSHGVFFRNWLWGDETGNFPAFTTAEPDWGFSALDLQLQQNYYSVVGNVMGKTGLHTNWSNADIYVAKCGWSASRNKPSVYTFGCDFNGSFSSSVWNTTIKHGNYDFKTLGVAHWDGGPDRTLKNSMYYTTKPAFYGNTAWPSIGPDISKYGNDNPAKIRYDSRVTPIQSTRPPAMIGAALLPVSMRPKTLAYQIPKAGNVIIEIYSVAGKRIDRLVDGYQAAGIHTISWKATGYPPGIYFFRLTVGALDMVKKKVIIEGCE
jgi:hypothetical protein